MAEATVSLREAPVPGGSALPLADFLAGSYSGAVRIEPGEEVRLLVPHLARLTRVDIAFPTFGDGRGYSSARILREAGYAGPLVATGDILVDQIAFMARCGFDGFAPTAPLDPAGLAKARSRWPHAYQPAADAARPLWALRHG